MEIAERPSLKLSSEEIVELTNGLTQPHAQLKELHRRGFVRASRPRNGPVVLSRAHYLAVEQARPAEPVSAGPAITGPNIVGLEQWQKGRKRGTQTQGR